MKRLLTAIYIITLVLSAVACSNADIPQNELNELTDEPSRLEELNEKSAQDLTVMGYIHDFNPKKGTFQLDEIEWLTWQDDERMEELGVAPDDMPSGFCIYNPDESVQSYKLADKVEFIILDWEKSFQPETVDFEEFSKTFTDNQREYALFGLEIQNGEVVTIIEAYVP